MFSSRAFAVGRNTVRRSYNSNIFSSPASVPPSSSHNLLFPRSSARFNSSKSSSSSSNPFGNNRKESLIWFAKATAGAGLLGYALSETVFSDERVESFSRSLQSTLGIDLSTLFGVQAHAFTLIDNGQHPAHYPWEHHSLWKTYDHAA